MARITRRTGKTDRIGGVFGAIVSGLFSLVGFAIPTPSSMDPFFSGGDGFDTLFIVFKVVWIGLCWVMCAVGMFTAIKGEGIAKETVDVDSNGDPLIQVRVDAPANKAAPELDFEVRLRKIEKLRDDGLIAQSEFDQKRKQIMEDKW